MKDKTYHNTSLGIWLSQSFSGNVDFHPKKFGRTTFRPEFFWIFQISNRKKSDRKIFSPKIFR